MKPAVLTNTNKFVETEFDVIEKGKKILLFIQ